MPDTMLFAWMGDDVEAILFARVRSHDRVRRDRRRSRSETARALEGSSGDLLPPPPPSEQTNRNRLIGISKKAPLNAGLELRGRGLAYPAPLRSI